MKYWLVLLNIAFAVTAASFSLDTQQCCFSTYKQEILGAILASFPVVMGRIQQGLTRVKSRVTTPHNSILKQIITGALSMSLSHPFLTRDPHWLKTHCGSAQRNRAAAKCCACLEVSFYTYSNVQQKCKKHKIWAGKPKHTDFFEYRTFSLSQQCAPCSRIYGTEIVVPWRSKCEISVHSSSYLTGSDPRMGINDMKTLPTMQ